ncbi:alpha/beta hydrolase [Zavarzinia sp. CC-PAN008]|uniref:alpha/beta hydrolase n=1 Tax=Zavarzinia sp. CC-PAN008 TaxID=3243332 RepID=UPI003F749A53
MMWLGLGLALVIVGALGAAACSPLKALDLVVSSAGYTVQADQPYGSLPRQKLDVYRPDAPAKALVVFYYGGGWNSGEKGDYRFMAQTLTANGYAVVLPDYRLVPAIHYPDFVEDSAAAMAWALDHRQEIAPGRPVFVMGHSAGAYNGAMVAYDPPFLERHGHRIQEIAGFVGLAGPYDFLPLDSPLSKGAFGEVADLPSTQPVNKVTVDAPEALLIHGEADDTVYLHNPRSLKRALEAKGNTVTFITYPEIGHLGPLVAFASPLGRNESLRSDVLAWLDARSGPAVPASH